MRFKPSDVVSDWRHKSALERVTVCRIMLAVHGFLTEGENKAIKTRIAKWAKAPTRAGAPGAPGTPRTPREGTNE